MPMLVKILSVSLLVLIIAGFTFLAITDVPIVQSEVTQTVPADVYTKAQ